MYCKIPINDNFINFAADINMINGKPLIMPVPMRRILILKSVKNENDAL